jgi:putative transposase
VFLKINGRIPYLWRAVDQDGDVLDVLVQSKRDKKAAKKFFRKLLKGIAVCAACDHYRQVEELQRGESRCVSGCRTPATSVWEQPRGKFTSANEIARAIDEAVQITGHAQRFLSVFGIIAARVGQHQYRAAGYRPVMRSKFTLWEVATGTVSNHH